MSPAILIVEDEHSLADLLEDRLEHEGFQVKVAYTGADALLKLKEDRPDAITLDIYLPDANGLTILRKLKASPDTNRIPVIIISSSDEDRGARNLGADEYLSKPIDFPRLLQTLKAVKPSD